MFVHLWWWFQHFTGVDAPGSRTYNFWSGFGSDLSEFALVGVIIKGLTMYTRHHREHMAELRRQRNDRIKL